MMARAGGGSYSGAMLIAQISDCHIVDPGELFAERTDSADGLRRAIDPCWPSTI